MKQTKLWILLLVAAVCSNAQFTCPQDEDLTCLDGLYPHESTCSQYYSCTDCVDTVINCDIFQHFDPIEKECQDPEDARCDGSLFSGTAFSVGFGGNGFWEGGGSTDPLPFVFTLVNHDQPYDYVTSRYFTDIAGTYFFHLSGGTRPAEPLDIHIHGLPYTANVFINDSFHYFDVQSRDIMAQLEADTTLYTYLEVGTKLNFDSGRPTLWGGFCLDEFMDPVIAFNAAGTSPVTGPGLIRFDNVLVDTSSAYNSGTGIFTAPTAGTYYFTFSTGIDTNHFLDVQFSSNLQGPITVVSRSQKSEIVIDNFDTLSKSLLVNLAADEQVSMTINSGTATNLFETLLSFGGFLYQPVSPNNAYAWCVYTTSRQLGPASKVNFDTVTVNTGDMFDMSSDTVTIVESGFYYISMTMGTDNSDITDVLLEVTDSGGTTSVAGVRRSDTIGGLEVDTISRSLLIHLKADDVLSLNILFGVVYSNPDRLTSFSGFLLYPIENPLDHYAEITPE